jgi:hypothetical protein
MAVYCTQIFTLDIGGRPMFAFEAADADEARLMVRSDWLLCAVDHFCRTRHLSVKGQLRLRVAEPDEAELYSRYADEFADSAPRRLIAHLVVT